MNAAQMLAAAGEPNTKAGREKFHKRFPTKQAFDAWYTPKKEYGGGLTDGIAFPQQPDASSNRAPYYEKGGFFAPNVMPWNGPIGFYEQGGLTDEIAFPQQPTDHINFSAFPWQPQYAMGGKPCYECGGNYMEPGGVPSPYKQAPSDPDAWVKENIDDPYNKYLAGKNKKINDYNAEHPYIPAGGNLFKRPDGSSDRFQYTNGAYMPYVQPTAPLVTNKYGGYMETGGTTQMDQGPYTDGMANQFMQSIKNFTDSAQPTPQPYDVQEAGVQAAYGYEVLNNQNDDFNTLDMGMVGRTSAMEDRLGQYKNDATKSLYGLGNALGSMATNRYAKDPKYKVIQGKPVTIPTQQASTQETRPAPANDWATTRSNAAAEQASANMFKEYGGNYMEPGGRVSNVNWQNRVQDILMRGQARPNFSQSKTQLFPVAQQQAPPVTTQAQQQYTPEQIAAFQSMMQNYFNQAQSNYAPNWQAMAQNAAHKNLMGNTFLNDLAWKGYGRKGKATFRTYYDPSTGKNVSVPDNQQQGAGQSMQQPAKGPGFLKNLIAKGKQRKANKLAKQQQAPLTDQEKRMMFPENAATINTPPANTNSIFPQNYPATPYDPNMPQHFLPSDNTAGFPVWNDVNLQPRYENGPGFAYGGSSQYDFNGYPEYAVGGEQEMTDDEIANYLAMGGTLEYLD